ECARSCCSPRWRGASTASRVPPRRSSPPRRRLGIAWSARWRPPRALLERPPCVSCAMRSRRLLAVLLLAGALMAGICAGRAGAQPAVDAERALASYAAMQRQYYMPWHHLYRGEEIESGEEFAHLWP